MRLMRAVQRKINNLEVSAAAQFKIAKTIYRPQLITKAILT